MSLRSDRIKSLIEQSDKTYLELERITGIKKSSLQRYASGATQKIPLDAIEKLSQTFGVSQSYLMGWSDSPEDSILTPIDGITSIKKKRLPLLGDIACGEPIYADECFNGYVAADEDLEADFCLRCKGDSMVGARIFDGDIVFIRRQPDVDDGQIAAVYIDGEATLKRVYKFPGRLILRAENPSFAPIEVTESSCDTVLILGRAVAVYGILK